MKQIEFYRGGNPENCQAFRDKEVIDKFRNFFEDWTRQPDLELINSVLKHYDEQTPPIRRPNCRLEVGKELLATIAPGFDLQQLDHSIANADWQNIEASEKQKEKILGTLFKSIPFGMVLCWGLGLATVNSIKDLGKETVLAILMSGSMAGVALAGLAIGIKLQAITDSTYPQTTKQITQGLEAFFKSEGIQDPTSNS